MPFILKYSSVPVLVELGPVPPQRHTETTLHYGPPGVDFTRKPFFMDFDIIILFLKANFGKFNGIIGSNVRKLDSDLYSILKS